MIPDAMVCPKDNWVFSPAVGGGRRERGLWGFTQVQAFPHPLCPILSITTRRELIAMAAQDPWPPIGSLVAMGYRAVWRPPREACV